VSLYDRVRDLPLVVESYELDGLSQTVRTDFTRRTTLVHLLGAGEEGIGEDVTYDGEEQARQQDRGPVLPLAGEWTLDGFSHHLDGLPLFEQEPEQHAYLDYRRWALESAALDLALRQAGISLGDAVGRTARPVTFVASGGLGEPPTTERLRAFLAVSPGLRFKLDARPSWTDEIVAELVELGCVDSIDFKGHYTGTIVDNPPDAELYRRIVEAFPDAWIEDPGLTDETLAVLEPHAGRVTWDAPIHSVADIEALAWPPRTVNVKPSRFGSVERLFAAYDYCTAQGIGAYGGGQFELGPGRGQIQLLAALFHPDTPNDVAPGGYNETVPTAGLPSSPLAVTPRATGFLASTS
jgi:L-alanine-DL-glutamate epimerase-like enolase superfamily enzyme